MFALVLCPGVVLGNSGLDPQAYSPIWKFDQSASEYCFPDYPSAVNDGRCQHRLDVSAPVFYQVDSCGDHTVFTYWLWYGKQKPCVAVFDDGHGNDWEHVSVYVKPSTKQVELVVFYQHAGRYTVLPGGYEQVNSRPVVYVGKVGHGSYSFGCSSKCRSPTFVFFFSDRCLKNQNFCRGGCGYWDDFRNPAPDGSTTLTQGTLVSLQEGQTIDGIARPDRQVCITNEYKPCKGDENRKLTTSGCWANQFNL